MLLKVITFVVLILKRKAAVSAEGCFAKEQASPELR